MPTPLTDAQVIEAVDWLENQPGERDMRTRTSHWHELFDMTEVQDYPDHVSRGDTRDTPSPFLIELAQDMQAERHAGQTSVTLVAIDRDVPQGTVDRIEKYIAMIVADFLRRWRLQDEAGIGQLCSYAGVVSWEYAGAKADRPYQICTPGPLESFFSVTSGGPQRPPMFGTKYEALIGDVERNYGGASGLMGTNEYRPVVGTDRKWSWQKLSDERPVYAGRGMNSSRFGDVCTHIKFDDGAYQYHVVLHPGQQKEGFMLWYDENRCGPDEDGNLAAAALIVPGGTPGVGRLPRNRLLPALLPGIQYTHILNYATSLMATRVEQSTGDVLVEQSPEMVEALANTGRLTASSAALHKGNPSIIEVAGKPMLWEKLPLQDLRDLVEFFRNERDNWANSLREISNPAQLAEINTNVYLPHAAARRQKLKPMNDAMDWMIDQLVRFSLYSLQYANAKPSRMVARGDEYYGSRRKQMRAGDVVEVRYEDVRDFDKRFVLSIATTNISDAELRQRMIDHDDKVMRGYATKRQGVGILYPDEEAQVEVLAEDEAYIAATQLLTPQIATTVQRKLRLRGGILLPMEGAIPPPASPGSANAGQEPYPQPVIPGPQSSNSPTVGPPGATPPVAVAAP